MRKIIVKIIFCLFVIASTTNCGVTKNAKTVTWSENVHAQNDDVSIVPRPKQIIMRPGTFRSMPGRADITIHPPVHPADYGEDVPALMHDVRETIRTALSDWERGED